jgi:hypothetical protein
MQLPFVKKLYLCRNVSEKDFVDRHMVEANLWSTEKSLDLFYDNGEDIRIKCAGTIRLTEVEYLALSGGSENLKQFARNNYKRIVSVPL